MNGLRSSCGVLGVVGLVWASVSAEIGAAGRGVTIRGEEGHSLQGFLIEASQRPSPAVVLVPMLGRSKEDWQAVAQRLADANITALAVDLRQQAPPEDATWWNAWSADVSAALSYLATRPEVRPDALGVAGASLGATLAAAAAVLEPRVRAIALVSPSLDYRGLRLDPLLRQYGARPALLVASLRDPYAARSVRELIKDASGLREIRWGETAAHGSILLSHEPELITTLVEWFQRTLGAR